MSDLEFFLLFHSAGGGNSLSANHFCVLWLSKNLMPEPRSYVQHTLEELKITETVIPLLPNDATADITDVHEDVKGCQSIYEWYLLDPSSSH